MMEKAMATHSSTLAWKIPGMEEPGRQQSMGSLRVGHDWATSLSLLTFMHWRRKWQPTPMFLPGESQGRGSLVGRCLWDHTESDTTEVTQQQQQQRLMMLNIFSHVYSLMADLKSLVILTSELPQGQFLLFATFFPVQRAMFSYFLAHL